MTQKLDSIREREIHEIFPLLYEELRNLARGRLAAELPGQTLQATALVHEAYLRLAASGNQHWQDRSYFFAAAAEAMRRILIDRARARNAARRGGRPASVPVEDLDLAAPMPDDALLALDAALEKLAALAPMKAELVKLKFFAGLTTEQSAGLLGISEATAKRSWAFARAWLARDLRSPSASA